MLNRIKVDTAAGLQPACTVSVAFGRATLIGTCGPDHRGGILKNYLEFAGRVMNRVTLGFRAAALTPGRGSLTRQRSHEAKAAGIAQGLRATPPCALAPSSGTGSPGS